MGVGSVPDISVGAILWTYALLEERMVDEKQLLVALRREFSQAFSPSARELSRAELHDLREHLCLERAENVLLYLPRVLEDLLANPVDRSAGTPSMVAYFLDPITPTTDELDPEVEAGLQLLRRNSPELAERARAALNAKVPEPPDEPPMRPDEVLERDLQRRLEYFSLFTPQQSAVVRDWLLIARDWREFEYDRDAIDAGIKFWSERAKRTQGEATR